LRLVLSILVGITIFWTICQSYLALGISPRILANEADLQEIIKMGQQKPPSSDPKVIKLREAAEKALWQANKLTASDEMLSEDWRFFSGDESPSGRERFRKSVTMVANLRMDKSAYSQAADCYKIVLKQDEYFHPNSLLTAIDLNNIGVSYALAGTTTKEADKKAEQFSLALSNLKDAEQRLRNLKDDDALLDCLTNQYILLNDMHDKIAAQKVFAQINQRDKSAHKVFKRLILEQQ
jgi:tetratricopeptide (TPR) repeat protein